MDQKSEVYFKRFDKLLNSYALSIGLSRPCASMNCVEAALLTIIDKGADKTHTDRVLVALAGTEGGLIAAEFAMSMAAAFCGPTQEEADDLRNQMKEEELTKAAQWLVSGVGRFGFLLRMLPGTKRHCMSFNDAKQLLICMLTEYFSPQQQEAVA